MFINNPGHMTKMAAMPIYGKNLQTSLSDFKEPPTPPPPSPAYILVYDHNIQTCLLTYLSDLN